MACDEAFPVAVGAFTVAGEANRAALGAVPVSWGDVGR
jgi:hypothetical protein